MLTRILTAVVGLPVLIGIVALGDSRVFAALVAALTLVALIEYFHMALAADPGLRVVGVAAGAVVAAGILLTPGLFLESALLASTFALLCIVFLFSTSGDLQQRYYNLGVTVVGVIYLGLLFPHFGLLYREGKEWVLWVLAVVFAGDTAAYFVGMALGRRRLYPAISPGKTIAGAWASVAGSLIAGLAAGHALIAAPLVHLAVLAVVLNVLAQIGDLFESWIKRTFATKDTGRIIPGHGGVMDRIDSLIFPGLVSSYYVRLLHG